MLSTQKPIFRTVAIIGIIFVVSLLLVYFFAWRPSNENYTSATSTLNKMVVAKSIMNSASKSVVSASNIDDSLVADMEKVAKQYNDDNLILSKHTVVTRDSTIKSAYGVHADTLASYGKSMDNLVNSLKFYKKMQSECGSLVGSLEKVTTVKDFDSFSKSCTDAINAAKAAPSQQFNDQFLDDGLPLMSDLVGEYRKMIVATESKTTNITASGIMSVKEKLVQIAQNKLTLTITPDPTDAIKELVSVIDKQKASFLR